ncbi:MAG TPA: hypothetical protein VF092_16835 [Longimicrobium sp.]
MTKVRRALACGAIAAALGFGGAQALAAPGAAVVAGERQCNQGQCSRQCKAAGYDGGNCAGGMCSCFIGPIQ